MKKGEDTMNRKLLLVVMLLLVLATVPAFADSLTVSLTSPPAFGEQGELLSFYATVSAPLSNSGLLYLNSDAFTITGPLQLDDSPFFANFPLTLSPGQNTSALLFTVLIPAGTPAGEYTGFFQILGGSDPFSLDEISNVVMFTIDVPEPATVLVLFVPAVFVLFVFGRRKLVPLARS